MKHWPVAEIVAFDLGTNTFRWLALAPDGSEIGRGREIVSLGAALANEAAISDTDAARAADLLARWRPGSGIVPAARRVVPVGTHALRAAANGQSVAAQLGAALGSPVCIIDPAEEAAFTFAGAAGKRRDGACVGVLDIGGGSTEIAWGRRGRIEGSISLPVGVVTQRGEAHEKLYDAVRRVGATVDAACRRIYNEALSDMVGSLDLRLLLSNCGTSSAIAQVFLGEPEYVRSRVDGAVVPTAWLERWRSEHAHSVADDFAALPGVGAKRKDLMAAGIGILSAVLAAGAFGHWTNVESGLLEGLAHTELAGGKEMNRA